MSTLNKEFKEKIESLGLGLGVVDNTSKELFLVAHNEFLKVSSEHLKSLNKELNETLKDTIVSDEIRQGVKRVITVAYKYSELKAITYVNKLTYSNIKGVVTLLSYINKEHKDELKAVKNKLSRVKGEGVVYNNNMLAKLKEIKSAYQLVTTEEGKLIKIAPSKLIKQVANNIEEFTQQQRDELIALLTA